MSTYFRSNTLATVTLVLLVAYWTFGLIIPGRFISSFGSCAITVAGAALTFASAKDSWGIMKRGDIGPAELATLGVWSLGFGAFYRGIWGIVWTLNGFPPYWVGTVHSSFGNYVMTAGVFSLFLAPDAARNSIKLPRPWHMALWIIAVAAMMIVLGMQIQTEDRVSRPAVIEQNLPIR